MHKQTSEVKDPSINTWGISTAGQAWDGKYKCLGVAGSIPTGGKLFTEINLPNTAKQYENDKISNFVNYGENSNVL